MNACVSSSSGMKKSDDLDEDPARAVQAIRRQLEDYAGSGRPTIHTYIHTYIYTGILILKFKYMCQVHTKQTESKMFSPKWTQMVSRC